MPAPTACKAQQTLTSVMRVALAHCRLPLAVEPSTLPVALQLLRDGVPLPTRVVEGEDGPSQVAVLEGLPAGSSGVQGVRHCCCSCRAVMPAYLVICKPVAFVLTPAASWQAEYCSTALTPRLPCRSQRAQGGAA